ncbi:UDP-N-acetylglucosamine---dolichyl-phosphate N-acetylglucosaminyltransferase [Candidatus Hakubella thermalkaliphila]|uniref:UDP-N-acetylglucosamine---dolichyl-phosphate N-acetylglucosaminyltransferase n=1 Tax=Candidatus Hakubella thermalkaliphila TaxID=2754717 RepID=A0A6V8P0M3_9ACTN|nr:UDP-N-acetylglucosamine---dolichyl-phosphate N-acetylglucosaminyltransferase [Candidatus Hakubella thermalkaliphila]
MEKEIIVVDDGSTDGTREILKRQEKDGLQVLYHPRNRGKGAALRTGFAAASGDYLLIQDADLEYDPQDYRRLLSPILKGKAQVVYGSRFTGERRNMLFWHMVGNRFLSFLTNRVWVDRFAHPQKDIPFMSSPFSASPWPISSLPGRKSTFMYLMMA